MSIVQKKGKKANSLVAIIKKGFLTSLKIYWELYKILVRVHPEYANQNWNTPLKKHKIFIENMQRRATKLIPQFGGLSYNDRLKFLNRPTLEFRRQSGSMVEFFKIVKGLYDRAVAEDFSRVNERVTWGNPCKLRDEDSKIALRRNFFYHSCSQRLELTTGRCHRWEYQCIQVQLDKHWEEFQYNVDFWMKMDTTEELIDRGRHGLQIRINLWAIPSERKVIPTRELSMYICWTHERRLLWTMISEMWTKNIRSLKQHHVQSASIWMPRRCWTCYSLRNLGLPWKSARNQDKYCDVRGYIRTKLTVKLSKFSVGAVFVTGLSLDFRDRGRALCACFFVVSYYFELYGRH